VNDKVDVEEDKVNNKADMVKDKVDAEEDKVNNKAHMVEDKVNNKVNNKVDNKVDSKVFHNNNFHCYIYYSIYLVATYLDNACYLNYLS
jgi:hypothetical protein